MERNLDSYLAGVFDGEGWITATFHEHGTKGGTQATRLIVGVGMKYRPIPKLFHERFGGSLRTYQDATCRVHQWYVCGRNSIEALSLFAELCLEKREQAEYGLILANELGKRKTRKSRPRGSWILSDTETQLRKELCETITRLKH